MSHPLQYYLLSNSKYSIQNIEYIFVGKIVTSAQTEKLKSLLPTISNPRNLKKVEDENTDFHLRKQTDRKRDSQ